MEEKPGSCEITDEKKLNISAMKFDTVIPILYSSDIPRSISYYTGKLGFDSKWEWDQPPTFGGVSRDCIEIFFCKDAQGQPGTWLSVFMDNVDEYYEYIRNNGATIICPPENMEWNVREMVVEDPDGHKIRFGQRIED
jgi:catechol 2,3-dioxygenase-like lactoylglutathione lyase family enzyme